MLVAEACLLQAVRDRIRTQLALTDEQCDVELDDQIPAIAPNDYYAVTAAGIQAGRHHRPSGGVYDVTISVRVTLFRRVPHIARDRRRHVFLDLLTGIAGGLEQVIRALDHSYELIDAAKAIETALAGGPSPPAYITANSTAQWPEPFRAFAPDTAAKMVYRDPYEAAQTSGPPGDPIVAISRGIVFRDARYMQVR